VNRTWTFSGEECAAFSVGLVFDESGAAWSLSSVARPAVATVLKTANRDDEVFLVELGDNAKLSVGFTPTSRDTKRG